MLPRIPGPMGGSYVALALTMHGLARHTIESGGEGVTEKGI
jgi:hypothetical protein